MKVDGERGGGEVEEKQERRARAIRIIMRVSERQDRQTGRKRGCGRRTGIKRALKRKKYYIIYINSN